MEIVRQRKKRLLAWILTLVLCVGMWQGNVQAEGEDGGDGAITPTEAMPTEVKNIKIDFKYNCFEEEYSAYFGEVNVSWSETNAATWEISDSGDAYITSGYTNDDLDLSGVIFNNGEYEHNVLKWRYNSIDKATGEIVEIEQESGDVMFSNMVQEEDGSYKLTAILGKSVRVHLPNSNEVDYCHQTSLDNEAKFSVELPDLEDSQQGIFKGWRTKIDEGENSVFNGMYIKSFNDLYDFEIDINFYESYSELIMNADSYQLFPTTLYFLGESNRWKLVNDGYTYEAGINFYIDSIEAKKMEFQIAK